MTITTFAHFLNRLLAPDENDESYPVIWIADEFSSVFIASDTGRVLAELWGGDRSKYHAAVFVSLRRALRLMNRLPDCEPSLRAFPRVALDLPEFRATSRSEAQRIVENLLA
jgi:hypothetical protein